MDIADGSPNFRRLDRQLKLPDRCARERVPLTGAPESACRALFYSLVIKGFEYARRSSRKMQTISGGTHVRKKLF